MAEDSATKAKAKRLHGEGKSGRQIAAVIHKDVKTIQVWIKEWIKGGFPKGFLGSKLDQVEEKAATSERERLGLSKARIEAKIVQRLEAKMAVRVTDSGSYSTCPLPAGIEVDADGKAMFGGSHITVTDDARTQDKALDQAIAILGLAKVQIDPSDGFRDFFQGLRGSK